MLTAVGARLGRDSAVYALAAGLAFPFALLNVAAYTRLLEPADYGQLAILLVSAGLLTTVYNAGTLQGTLAVVYGAADGELGSDDDEGGHRPRDRRAALTTGSLMTLTLVIVASLPIFLVAPKIAGDLLGDATLTTPVRWAAGCAGSASCFRLAVNVMRMERRATTYALLNTLRLFAALAIGIPLVAAGAGIAGVLAGLALGTSAATLMALAVGRYLYAPRLTGSVVRAVFVRGLPNLPVIVGFWIVQNADILLLSGLHSPGQVADYRVASRISAGMSFVVSAFLMASAPLERTSLVRAAHDRFSRSHVRSLMVTYYVVAGVYAVLFLTLSADALVLIAAPSYRTEAGLIPILAAGFLMYGLVIFLSRVAFIPRRGRVHRTIGLMSGIAFLVVCSALIREMGELGAALAMPLVLGGAVSYWLFRIARSDEPLDLPWRRLAGAVAVAAAAYGATLLVADEGTGRLAADVAAAVICPLLFVTLGIVPLRHVRPLSAMARTAVLPRQQENLTARVAAVSDANRRRLMAALAGDARDPSAAMAALREIGGPDVASDDAELLAVHLFGTGSEADRVAGAEALWRRGVDPLVLHELEELVDRLRRLPRRIWQL